MGTLWPLLLALLVVQPSVASRLPTHVVPEKYTIDIVTRLGDDGEDFSFDGRARITVRVDSPTDSIVLHSKNLDIDDKNITVRKQSRSKSTARNNLFENVTHIPENELLIIRLSQNLVKNELYLIDIRYKGNLSEGVNGYFLSSYQDQAGRQRWLAVTHFASSSARKAFPCFDEPEMKAQFQLNLARRGHYRTASNMPIKTTERMARNSGWYWDAYHSTPNMSTYLVAFMVADFPSADCYSGEDNPVPCRVWARPEAMNQTDYARLIGPKYIKYYEEFFNISYPLSKLDMAAIPDFAAGGMENWGFALFSEPNLLYSPEVSSPDNKLWVAGVVAHELAHQWFGNLVTIKWWSDLWMNEGFATYITSLAVNSVHPEWRILDNEAFDHIFIAMSRDVLKSSHPVYAIVNRPDEVEQIFDEITYEKGASLLQMTNRFLGERVFRRGVNSFLRQHQYKNAGHDDLWSTLTEEAHRQRVLPADMTMKGIMDTWTFYTGYPVVTVTRDYQRRTATLTQAQYLLYTTQSNNTTRRCWTIPITYSSDRKPTFEDTIPKIWMTSEREVTNIPNMPGPEEWVIFNNRASGLYRVQYDQNNWRLISRALKSSDFQKINILNRAQILNDLLDFAWTGNVGYNLALDVARYLQQERKYLPWRVALVAFDKLDKILRRTSAYEHYRNYLKSLLAPQLEKINITVIPERPLENRHHVQLVTWACRLEMEPCVQTASKLFQEWATVTNPDIHNPIPRDLRSIVYCTAVKHGSELDRIMVWERYFTSNVTSEKRTLLTALGCARDTTFLRRLVQTAHTSNSPFGEQYSAEVFVAVTNNDIGYFVAKDYFTRNISSIYEYLQPNAATLSSYITALAQYMTTENDLNEWQQFLSRNEGLLKESELAIQESMESIQVNVLWRRNRFQDFSRAIQQLSTM